MIKKLVNTLRKNNLTISTVESCTGGHFIDMITNVEGASDITNGGVVVYSNAQKIKIGVPSYIIDKHGVYSKECARAMAEVGIELFSADICVGITGTLSNIDSNNLDSERGKVYYSIKINFNNNQIDLSSALMVPIKRRDLQKEYIVNSIVEKLNQMLEGDCN